MRAVDRKATERARERQEKGADALNAIFGWTPAAWAKMKGDKRRGFPPVERERRRLRNRHARAARRRNQ